MPDPVERAFNKLSQSTINLSPLTDKAYASCEYLFTIIKKLAQTNKGFPQLYGDVVVQGSFTGSAESKTLDKLDILLLLSGIGTEVTPSPASESTYWLKLLHLTAPLSLFPDKYGYVNSTKVLNSLKNYLTSVKDSQITEIIQNKSALALLLSGYDWKFEIVPAVPVDNKDGTIIYYLIPDGLGNWKKINI